MQVRYMLWKFCPSVVCLSVTSLVHSERLELVFGTEVTLGKSYIRNIPIVLDRKTAMTTRRHPQSSNPRRIIVP